LYKDNPQFVLPAHRLTEIKNFVEAGLQDFSISRLKSKMPWGVAVPDDEEQVMYVWFDALVNYISTLGWPQDEDAFAQWWPGVQVAGKDNLRQQSAMWQAMLLSAQLPPSRQIVIHGFITSDKKKMSKSLGNVVSPAEVIQKYSTDALRYYLLREIPAQDDGDFSFSRMDEVYNADLANELGNLVMRLTTLGAKDNLVIKTEDLEVSAFGEIISQAQTFQFPKALELLWLEIKALNKKVDGFEPWKKEAAERRDFLIGSLRELHTIAIVLKLFLPQTGESICSATSGIIMKSIPLFPKNK
jgi:methionyl-tRNA synthetase